MEMNRYVSTNMSWKSPKIGANACLSRLPSAFSTLSGSRLEASVWNSHASFPVFASTA
jgi:hypothetical protein